MPAPLTPAAIQAMLTDMPILIERMHRRFLDVIRIEMAKVEVADISPVQMMMLCTIGDQELSVRDLIERGYYLGSNASYNLKQLVAQGYVERQASLHDKRAARLKLTAKGQKVLTDLNKLSRSLAEPMVTAPQDAHDMDIAWKMLRKLERRWSDAVRYTGGMEPGDR